MRLAWGQIKRRKVVTALCMTGISIGCAAIIVAISIGNAAQSYLDKEITGGMKLDEITVTPQSMGGNRGSGEPDGLERGLLTEDKVRVIEGFRHVKSVIPSKQIGYLRFVSSDNLVHDGINVNAVDMTKLREQGHQFQQGSPLDQVGAIVLNYGATTGWKDSETAKKLMEMINSDPNNPALWEEYEIHESNITDMMGKSIQPEQMLGEKTALGPQLYIGGILDVEKGQSPMYAMYDRRAYISFETAEWLSDYLNTEYNSSTKQRTFDTLTVKVDDLQNIRPLEELISKLALNATDNLAMRDQIGSQLNTFKAIALGIGIFILLLASISIIVAMTMSTHQRRRQIGIMKVLGANMGQIRIMFIVEASVLGFLGGLLGIVFAFLIINGLNSFITASAGMSGLQIAVTLDTLPIGIAFAVMTGILSGIYPAISAARTNALLAIKRD